MGLQKIVDKMVGLVAGIALASSLNGCAADKFAKYSMPANLAVCYFGALATHEGGHAAAATAMGADSVDVTLLPSEHQGNTSLGYTSYERSKPFNDLEETAFSVSGPLNNLGAGIATREALRSGEVPYALQPAMQWYALGNKILFYGEVIKGLAGTNGSDLGQENKFISVTLLAIGLTYDLLDIFARDKPSRYFAVLFGESFYEDQEEGVSIEDSFKKEEDERVSVEFFGGNKEAYLGLRIGF